MNFEFEEETHEYRLDGILIPSVTQILTALGFIDARWFTTEGCIRGEKVHKGTVLLESPGGINWDSVKRIEDALATPIVPYLNAYARFLLETGWVSNEIERPRYRADIGVAGTPDRIGRFNGSKKDEGLEVKTGARQDWWKLQTEGGYRTLTGIYQWTTVRLKDDGDYVLETQSDFNTEDKFIALEKTYKTGREHGIYS